MIDRPARPEVTRRFSNRVADYERWRPGYPPELRAWLLRHCGLSTGYAVADVGSGTGLFARELLGAGLKVHAVEPNGPMREAAERASSGNRNFLSCDGRAEHTGLLAHSVDLITAAQAFHWFDPAAARAEFARILKPGGFVALIWNVRREDTPFLRDYEALLQAHAPEYKQSGVPAQADETIIEAFFSPSTYERATFPNAQYFDAEGLRGRLMSSSYAPAPGMSGHAEIIAACDAVFARHAVDNQIAFLYDARVYAGRL